MQLQSESAGKLLTTELQRYIIEEQDWPRGLQIGLDDRGDHILVFLYRDNFIRFDGVDIEQIAKVANRCFEKIRSDGVPIFLRVLPTKPKEGDNA